MDEATADGVKWQSMKQKLISCWGVTVGVVLAINRIDNGHYGWGAMWVAVALAHAYLLGEMWWEKMKKPPGGGL